MGLGHILEAFGKAAVSGIPGTAERYQNDAADLKARQADLEFANHLQEIGAKPVFHGLVQEEITAPDGSKTSIYRAPDPTRIKTTQKTAQGPIQWEVPSIEEQANRKIDEGTRRLLRQYNGETPVRQQQNTEAAAQAGAVARSTGNAQLDVTARNRAENGIVAPQSLQERFGEIFTQPVAPPAASTAAELPTTRAAAPAAPEGVRPAAELRQPRKFLPAELEPLMGSLASSENVTATVDAKQQQKAVQQLSSVTDQAGYDAVRQENPEVSARWPKIYSKPIVQSLIRQNVPVKDQPEYDIKSLTLQAMDSMSHDPAKIDAEIDGIIPPKGDTAALNNRTKLMVRSRMAQGDLKGAREVIKDSSDQIGRTETAVASARATAPIKIMVAGAEAAARGNAQLQASGVTDDDITRQGIEAAITGQMPQLGNGQGVLKARILHAKQQFARDSGLSPRDLAVAGAAFKGDVKSLAALQTQADQIDAFEKTARKNLQLFIDAAEKIPDTGIPWLNTPIRELSEKIVGSTNIAAVNAARAVATNEIAKVTAGGGLSGVLSDTARKEVKDYNPANATFAQTKAIAKILQADMENRTGSLHATIDVIKGRMASPGGAPAATPAAAAGATAPKYAVGQKVTLRNGQTVEVTEATLKSDGTYEYHYK